jgi:hypothetical protein
MRPSLWRDREVEEIREHRARCREAMSIEAMSVGLVARNDCRLAMQSKLRSQEGWARRIKTFLPLSKIRGIF